jgi:uncharacterized protein
VTGPGPRSDADVAPWVAGLGLSGLVDMHVHFLPDSVQRKVWAFFERASQEYGRDWPIRYKLPVDERLAVLRGLGVVAFAPLVYPHKPGMARWLNEWVAGFAAETPGAVPTATIYPEPDVLSYLDSALCTGIRCVKVHVQVGGFDPRSPLLDKAWGMIADAGLPVVVHCGHGPVPGEFTGVDVFDEVLERHPRLVAVIAHAGMPEVDRTLELVARFPRAHLETTMVGVDFAGARAGLPKDWAARLAGVADRVVLGTDFPSIPYAYAEQVAAIAEWAAADDRLGDPFLRAVLHDTPARLLGL